MCMWSFLCEKIQTVNRKMYEKSVFSFDVCARKNDVLAKCIVTKFPSMYDAIQANRNP